MPVVGAIQGLTLRLTGEKYTGWLPRGAVAPPGTDTKDVVLDLEIRRLDAPDAGFLLVSASDDLEFCGDSWHESLELALQQAEFAYGVRRSEWRFASSAER